jgi:hypothetical protein
MLKSKISRYFLNLAPLFMTLCTISISSEVRSMQVDEITENFYVGKIPQRALWLAMERITDQNIEGWQHYASIQLKPNYDAPLPSPDGVKYFSRVLNEVYPHKNEMWIAYVTAMPPNSDDHKFDGYAAEKVSPEDNKKFSIPTFPNQLKMFVTVVSSPSAKITSHMGISVTRENNYFPEKGISLDLHSFAAKVMLMRNPQRRLMLNAPTHLMESIMEKALPPKSVFIGTREMLTEYKRRQTLTIENYQEEKQVFLKDELSQIDKIVEELQKAAQELKEQNCFEEAEEYLNGGWLVLNENNDFVISTKGVEKAKLGCSTNFFKEFEETKKYPSFESLLNYVKNVPLAEYLSDHPAILSVDRIEKAEEWLRIYDPCDCQKLWLEINKEDTDYNWMFTKPFKPGGTTHYVAVDLKALANCKAVE